MKTFAKKIILLLGILLVSCENEEILPVDLFANPPVGIGHENGHGYVDLGLPSGLLWARCNLGAASPEGYGNYFCWGETEVMDDEKSSSGTLELGDISGFSDHDAARAIWGGGWRMPTLNEFQELVECCTFSEENINGVPGYKVTGTNGNSIFLPAAGYHDGKSEKKRNQAGYYWSSTNEKFFMPADQSITSYGGVGSKVFGHSIRPVLTESW